MVPLRKTPASTARPALLLRRLAYDARASSVGMHAIALRAGMCACHDRAGVAAVLRRRRDDDLQSMPRRLSDESVNDNTGHRAAALADH